MSLHQMLQCYLPPRFISPNLTIYKVNNARSSDGNADHIADQQLAYISAVYYPQHRAKVQAGGCGVSQR
jgi:hypothetical protein